MQYPKHGYKLSKLMRWIVVQAHLRGNLSRLQIQEEYYQRSEEAVRISVVRSLGRLKQRGLITERDGKIQLTEAGSAHFREMDRQQWRSFDAWKRYCAAAEKPPTS